MRCKRKLAVEVDVTPESYLVTYPTGLKISISAKDFEEQFEEIRPAEPAAAPVEAFWIVLLNGARATREHVRGRFSSKDEAQKAIYTQNGLSDSNAKIIVAFPYKLFYVA